MKDILKTKIENVKNKILDSQPTVGEGWWLAVCEDVLGEGASFRMKFFTVRETTEPIVCNVLLCNDPTEVLHLLEIFKKDNGWAFVLIEHILDVYGISHAGVVAHKAIDEGTNDLAIDITHRQNIERIIANYQPSEMDVISDADEDEDENEDGDEDDVASLSEDVDALRDLVLARGEQLDSLATLVRARGEYTDTLRDLILARDEQIDLMAEDVSRHSEDIKHLLEGFLSLLGIIKGEHGVASAETKYRNAMGDFMKGLSNAMATNIDTQRATLDLLRPLTTKD